MLAVTEPVKRGMTNFTVRSDVNCDHGFFEHARTGVECRHGTVLADIPERARHTAGA